MDAFLASLLRILPAVPALQSLENCWLIPQMSLIAPMIGVELTDKRSSVVDKPGSFFLSEL